MVYWHENNEFYILKNMEEIRVLNIDVRKKDSAKISHEVLTDIWKLPNLLSIKIYNENGNNIAKDIILDSIAPRIYKKQENTFRNT